MKIYYCNCLCFKFLTVMSNEQLHSYSSKLMPQIPIKYLLHQCQKQQQNYTGLYPALLQLLATHYPHLCLVEEWLGEEMEEGEGGGWRARERCKVKCTPERLQSSRSSFAVSVYIKAWKYTLLQHNLLLKNVICNIFFLGCGAK